LLQFKFALQAFENKSFDHRQPNVGQAQSNFGTGLPMNISQLDFTAQIPHTFSQTEALSMAGIPH